MIFLFEAGEALLGMTFSFTIAAPWPMATNGNIAAMS